MNFLRPDYSKTSKSPNREYLRGKEFLAVLATSAVGLYPLSLSVLLPSIRISLTLTPKELSMEPHGRVGYMSRLPKLCSRQAGFEEIEVRTAFDIARISSKRTSGGVNQGDFTILPPDLCLRKCAKKSGHAPTTIYLGGSLSANWPEAGSKIASMG
jgi:hypothetical protein